MTQSRGAENTFSQKLFKNFQNMIIGGLGGGDD